MEEGRNVFTIEYECGRIKAFEKKILTEGICKSFLPMSFVSFNGVERANYDCSGYQPIEHHEFKSSREMIDVLEKCVIRLIESSGHLINPRRIELNVRTVFYSQNMKEVKLAYVPKQIPAERAMHVFTELLIHLEKNIRNKEIYHYLRSILSYIEYNNGSMLDVINYFGELRQEIHACG